jgi:RHH-type rel operon transcriptional repressor/antitoxin RelB
MALSIRLPSDLEARLKNLAAKTGRTKSYYITEAIREHLDDLEDLYLAEQRLADIRSGKTRTVRIEEVMKRYGVED